MSLNTSSQNKTQVLKIISELVLDYNNIGKYKITIMVMTDGKLTTYVIKFLCLKLFVA